MAWDRVILHADMDAFFAAVEQLDFPELRGKPILIGGSGPRSVVATASYEARKYGVGSAMSMELARRKVPGAIIRPHRFERYKEISNAVMEVFATYAELIQPISIDEAFLDMSPAKDRFESPWAMGRALKRDVLDATGGLTISVGISATKFVAKVASDYHKPDGLTVVPPDEAVAFLAPQPVKRLWGAGPKTVERLHALGLQTIADVAACDLGVLTAALGSAGHHFWRLAHADDPRPVDNTRERKSLGAERTLRDDIVGAQAVLEKLQPIADEVERRADAKGIRGYGVRVKLKTRRFQIMTRQAHLPHPVYAADDLMRHAEALLAEFDLSEPLRLVGLTLYDLLDPEDPVQLELPLEDEP
ncbi:MAG: DNA polymerase IV [Myxococcales bacterium]|nr:DNA polymerase IV [Myxococcales bacterium]